MKHIKGLLDFLSGKIIDHFPDCERCEKLEAQLVRAYSWLKMKHEIEKNHKIIFPYTYDEQGEWLKETQKLLEGTNGQ